MDKERAVSNEDFYAFETAQRENIKFWQMLRESNQLERIRRVY
jgi:hypothetical protein